MLDGVRGDGTFLDIGCANGLLMESVARWGAEDGWALERTASTSHPGWPTWPDGASLTGPTASRSATRWGGCRRAGSTTSGPGSTTCRPGGHAYVGHLLSRVVARGGRLIVGSFNEESDADALATEVEAWGFRVAGYTRRPHRHPRLVYKAFWLDAPP